jgi:hypothetical protein
VARFRTKARGQRAGPHSTAGNTLNDNPKRLIRQLSWQGLPREIQQAYEADLDLMKLGGMSDKLADWAIKAGVKAGQTQTKPPWFNWHTMSNVSGPAKDYAKAMSKLTDARRAATSTRSGADYYRELDRIERERDEEARKLLEAAGAFR